MKVPLIYADYQGPIARVGNAGAGAYARADAGNMAVDLAGHVARQEAILKEREQAAQDTLTAIELDSKMGQAAAKIKESFLSRTDSENFDQDAQAQIQAMKDEFAPKNASQELTQAFARSFGRYSQGLADTVSTMKYRVMEERGRNAIGQFVDNAADEYAGTDDPAEKEIIKKGAEMRIREAINKNLVNPVWGENQIREFERYAKAKEGDAAEATAIDRMGKDPAQLAMDLKDPKYLPGLTDKSRRATLANQAQTAAKVQEAEKERKRKEIETELHDKEERNIGNLYMSGDYTKAYALALSSKVLKGDEKATWANAIKNAEKVKPDQIDPKIETAEIRKVNEMITQDKPLNEIRDYIIQSPNLGRGNKEQYINKLETNYSAEMKEMRTLGLNTIKDQIIPKRGITSKIIETPLESAAVSRGQIEFLDWLDAQMKAGKRISRTEALYKAMSIAAENQVSIVEQIDFLESEAKRIQEETKAAKKK